jgi:hypothetical protein
LAAAGEPLFPRLGGFREHRGTETLADHFAQLRKAAATILDDAALWRVWSLTCRASAG